MAIITINNAMGGQTANFLDQYTWSGHTLTYTANGSGYWFGGGMEGWTSGAPDYVEIFFFMGSWYSYDPFTFAMCQFTAFVLAPNGLNGLIYDSAFPPETMTFLPAGPPTPPDPPTDLSATDGTRPDDSQLTWLGPAGGSPVTSGFSAYRDDVLIASGLDDLLPGPPNVRDFTAFDETYDPNLRVAATATKLDVDAVTAEDDCWWGNDEGVGAISGFRHYVDITPRAHTSYGWCAVWAVSNDATEDGYYWYNNMVQAVMLHLQWSGSAYEIYLRNCETAEQSAVFTATQDVAAYYDIRRVGTMVSATKYGSAADRLAETNPLQSESVIVDAERTWEYVFGLSSFNTGTAGRTISVDVENLVTASLGPEYFYNDTGASSDEGNPSTYYVTAVGDGGESAPSNEDTGWKSGGEPPGPVTGVLEDFEAVDPLAEYQGDTAYWSITAVDPGQGIQ